MSTPKRISDASPIFRERIADGTAVPSPTDLARSCGGGDLTTFVHLLPDAKITQASLAPGAKALCAEAPAGGFHWVERAEFEAHPCPDCARRERAILSARRTP